jgi:hypothetical protein
MGRVAREAGDVARARESLEDLSQQLEAMEAEFEEAAEDLRDRLEPDSLEIEAYPVRPRKSDIEVNRVVLVWTPWRVTPQGIAEPIF